MSFKFKNCCVGPIADRSLGGGGAYSLWYIPRWIHPAVRVQDVLINPSVCLHSNATMTSSSTVPFFDLIEYLLSSLRKDGSRYLTAPASHSIGSPKNCLQIGFLLQNLFFLRIELLLSEDCRMREVFMTGKMTKSWLTNLPLIFSLIWLASQGINYEQKVTRSNNSCFMKKVVLLS